MRPLRSFSLQKTAKVNNNWIHRHSLSQKREHNYSISSNALTTKPAKAISLSRYERELVPKISPTPLNAKSAAIQQLINDYFNDQAFPTDQSSFTNSQLTTNSEINKKTAQITSGHFLAGRKSKRHRKEDSLFEQSADPLANMSKTSKHFSQNHNHSRLPPIFEIAEDQENLRGRAPYSQLSQSLGSSVAFQQSSPQKATETEDMLPAFQNEIFKVFVLFKGGQPYSRIKIFKAKGIPILERELKCRIFNLPIIWRQSNINSYSYQTGLQPPLRDLLCKMEVDEGSGQLLKIRPKHLFKRFSANGFQEMRHLLRSFCGDLLKVRGKVINNKINPQNIFLIKQYKLCLAEWGYSSFRDTFTTPNGDFESRTDPILRGDKDWLISPQYLAPELVNEYLGNITYDIWSGCSSPDIWSLGLTIFELMTLVPIWSTVKCLVVTKGTNCSTIGKGQKPGILGVAGRDLKKLYERQMSVQKQIMREIQSWSEEQKVIGRIVLRMVEPKVEQRISLQELIASF